MQAPASSDTLALVSEVVLRSFSGVGHLKILFTVRAHRALYLLERGAFAGERVLDARGMTPVLAPLDESFRFEFSELLGERTRAHAAQ